MSNNKYLRSRRREWEVMHYLQSKGFIATRSAGSHSAYDVWAWNPDTLEVCLVQIKTKKGARKRIIKDEKVYKEVKVQTWTASWE